MSKELNFVYAAHDEEYAEAIGTELATTVKPEGAIALEWASMSTDVSRVEYATKLVNDNLNGVVTAKSMEEAYPHLVSLGSFYANLMKPLVGSQVSVHLIDSYQTQHHDLAMRSYNFNNYELFRTLNAVVADGKMSLAQRRQVMTELAVKSGQISSARDEIVVGQLQDISQTHDAIGIFQGMGHQPVSKRMEEAGLKTSKVFVPELIAWPGQDEITELDREPQLYRLQNAIQEGEANDVVEELTDKALLAEYIVAYLLNNPGWRSEETNAYAAMIAAGRIVGGLDSDRVASKLKAAVKSSNNGQPLAKVIKPLMPKHSLKVTQQ